MHAITHHRQDTPTGGNREQTVHSPNASKTKKSLRSRSHLSLNQRKASNLRVEKREREKEKEKRKEEGRRKDR